MAALDAAAGVLMLGAQVVLILIGAGLAKRAHHADDQGLGDYPWALAAAFAGFTAIAALVRFPRWVTGTFSSFPEFVLIAGAEIAAGWFLVDFARRSHETRHDRRPRGIKSSGTILLVTATASTLIVLGQPGLIVRTQLLEAVGTGLIAWGLLAASAVGRSHPATPNWAPALAGAGAQGLVIIVWVRAVITNGLVAVNGVGIAELRLVHAASWVVAAAFAWPALDAAGRCLLAARAPHGALAEGEGRGEGEGAGDDAGARPARAA